MTDPVSDTTAVEAETPSELSYHNLIISMRAFAIAGLGPSEARLASIKGASQDFLTALGPTQERIGAELNDGALRAQQNRYFLPLPPPANDTPDGFFLAFFRPRIIVSDGEVTECEFHLFIVSGHKDRNTFGMRFERGRGQDDTHAYPHIQFTRKFQAHDPVTDLPPNLPNSYPAFPTRCWAPGDTWLALLVSLYGLSGRKRLALPKIVGDIEHEQKLPLSDVMIPRARHIFDVATAN